MVGYPTVGELHVRLRDGHLPQCVAVGDNTPIFPKNFFLRLLQAERSVIVTNGAIGESHSDLNSGRGKVLAAYYLCNVEELGCEPVHVFKSEAQTEEAFTNGKSLDRFCI